MKVKETIVSGLLKGLSYVGQASIYPWAFRQLRTFFQGEPARYLRFLSDQAERENWLGPFYAGHELHTVYSEDPEQVLTLLRTLSASEREIIREGAAHSWSYLLSRDFTNIMELLESLRQNEKYEMRYTAALAPVRYFDQFSNSHEQDAIRSFWKKYEDDPRQGLWNLVRQQILEPRTEPSE